MADTNALYDVISSELTLHPHMDERDLQKLIYQSVFGGDHLLADPQRFAAHVRREWSGLDPARLVAARALQSIDPDGRTARIHLAVCKRQGVDVERLVDRLLAQDPKRGRASSYRRRWSDTIALARAGRIPFDTERLEAVGYPESAPRHSPSYGIASYRIVHDISDPETVAGLRDLGVLG